MSEKKNNRNNIPNKNHDRKKSNECWKLTLLLIII